MGPKLIVATAALTAACLTGAPAAAQEDRSADVAAARELGIAGLKLAEAGNCADAIDPLTRAEQLRHAPTTLEKLGECQVKVGRLVEGTETLRRVLRESLPPNAPAVFVMAQERANTLLAEAKPRIAQLKIAIAAPPNAEFSVKVDGSPVPLVNLNVNRPMDPGEHVVEASGAGLLPAKARLVLSEGGADSVALTLQVDPSAAPAAPVAPAVVAPLPAPTLPPPAPPPAAVNRVPAWASLGVGGAGILLGAVFGGVAASDKGTLSTQCPGKVCPPSERGLLRSAKAMATASTASFVLGGVGLALGGTLLFTSNFHDWGPLGSANKKTAGLTVQTYFAGTSGGIRGEF